MVACPNNTLHVYCINYIQQNCCGLRVAYYTTELASPKDHRTRQIALGSEVGSFKITRGMVSWKNIQRILPPELFNWSIACIQKCTQIVSMYSLINYQSGYMHLSNTSTPDPPARSSSLLLNSNSTVWFCLDLNFIKMVSYSM